MKKMIFKPIAGLFIGALFLVSSCSKQEVMKGGSTGTSTTTGSNSVVEQRIRKLVENLPHVKATNSANQRNGADAIQGSGWDFSDPSNSGINYTTSYGLSYSASSNTFTLAGSGGGNGGGTVVAGASSLDMNYSFCFAVGGDVLGLGSIISDAPTSGVSGVIGVSGDFSKLTANSNGNDIAEAFNGMAFYVVYDGKASGTYDVVDWTDPDLDLNDTTGTGFMDKKCFAVVLDIKGGRLYFSSGGKIVVSGGSMNFNGEYLEVSGFEVDPNTGNYNLNDLKYKKVPGFGAMGCD